jgi:Skp family chaperone for outer membrane proteins
MRKPAILAAIIILAAFAAAFAFGALAPQNGHDQFQKALAKERGEGNLEEAIALYQKVIAETKDETLAAQASSGSVSATKSSAKKRPNWPRRRSRRSSTRTRTRSKSSRRPGKS